MTNTSEGGGIDESVVFYPFKLVHILIKSSLSLLGCNPEKFEADTPSNLYLPYTLIDLASTWQFCNRPDQREMISLPASFYETFSSNPLQGIKWLKDTLTHYDKIFEYKCISVTIFHRIHFSRLFILNAASYLKKKRPHDKPPTCFLYCNSSPPGGQHTLDKVTAFSTSFLNKIRTDLNLGTTRLSKDKIPHFHLKTENQHNGWICGFKALQYEQNMLAFLLHCDNITKQDITDLTYTGNAEKLVAMLEQDKNGLVICKELLDIVNFIDRFSTPLGGKAESLYSKEEQEKVLIDFFLTMMTSNSTSMVIYMIIPINPFLN